MSDIFQPLPFQGNGPDNAQAQQQPAQDITRKQRGPRRGQGKAKKVVGRRGRPKKAQPADVAVQPESKTGVKIVRAPRKPRAMKVDLGLAMSALGGLSADDARFLTGVVQAMQPFNKRSRQRIASALSRLV